MGKEKLTTSKLPGRTLHINNEEFLHFSGTSYLAISTNSQFLECLREAILQYGGNYGGSRLSNIQFPVYGKAEALIAKTTGSPSAITCTSGSLAGSLVLKQFSRNSIYIQNKKVHRAIHNDEAIRLDLATEEGLKQLLQSLHKEEVTNIIISSNSVDPLYAKTIDLSWVSKLPVDEKITLLFDDSHGIGICGKNGEGIYAKIKSLTANKLVVIASLGKALGIPGGVVLGDINFVNKIKASPNFGGASPIPPAYLQAFLKSQNLYQEQLNIVRNNIEYFKRETDGTGLFRNQKAYPVFYTENDQLTEFLFQNKVIISSFPYPGPKDKNITRVVINAAHTSDDLQKIVQLIHQFVSQ